MIAIENIEAFGIESAIRGMRNPMNSWERSDSKWVVDGNRIDFKIGSNDMDLATRLIKAGGCDRKFLRMIHIQADINAPRYWWPEWDQYKVATVTNSCSTMHKLGSRPLTIEDFSIDSEVVLSSTVQLDFGEFLKNYNKLIALWKKTENPTEKKEYWRLMIEWLPQSFMQKRTVDFNYETALAMYFQRRNHKLSEWHVVCDAIKSLPYMEDFIKALESKNGGN